MTMFRLILVAALLLAQVNSVLAGAGTITTKDAAGATKTFVVVTDGSGNFVSPGVVCDQSAAATCASVGTAGSPSTNALTVQAVTLGAGTAANAMRVELPTDGNGVIAGVTTVTTVSTVTSLSQFAGAAINLGAGAVGTGTLRITQASDSPEIAVLGATGDAAATAGSTGTVAAKLRLMTTQLDTIATNTGASVPAGTALIGNVGSATGSAPPSGAVYLGANASGATGGFLKGLITCDLHAKYDASDNGSITMVTGVSGRKVYVCGYLLATGGTAINLKLREGSDANCATNGADLTPAYQLVANDKIGALSPFWTGLVVSTNAYYICVNASAGNAHQAELWYTIL